MIDVSVVLGIFWWGVRCLIYRFLIHVFCGRILFIQNTDTQFIGLGRD
jgi:hypothetical protein